MLPEGDIHPDLAQRLAAEATKCAERMLQMCIRAIDYCPPVDITFGDFLRGIITADLDYAPEDKSGFRIVFIESFREWGIYPRGIPAWGSTLWRGPGARSCCKTSWCSVPSYIRRPTSGSSSRALVVSAMQNWNLESNRYRGVEGP